MYTAFIQVSATATVKTWADVEAALLAADASGSLLAKARRATSVELQASAQNVSYRCDNTVGGIPTQTIGMMLLTTSPPKEHLAEDARNIKFCRAAGSDGALNFHFLGGRDVT